MQRIKPGALLKENRLAKGIEANKICRGLCAESALSRYERGAHISDIILYHRLMQRTGISMENFVFMLDNEKYKYYRWRELVREALAEQRWGQLRELLEREEALHVKSSEHIRKQFSYFLRAVVQWREEQKKEAVDSIRLAAKQTIPDLTCIAEGFPALSLEEIHVLTLYLYYGLQEGTLAEDKGRELFQALEGLIYNGIPEDYEKAKVYPRLVCAWIRAGGSGLPREEQRRLCEKAIALLRDTQQLYDITEVLRLYVKVLKQENRECRFWEQQYENFCEIFTEGGLGSGFYPECSWARNSRSYLMGEYLRAGRKEKGLSQEETSNGICEPENYSRLETGRRAPRSEHYYALAERLGISWGYCRGELTTTDPALYQLRYQQRMAAQKYRWEESLKLLQKMEERLDMEDTVNCQYIKREQCLAEYRLKRKSAEDTYQQYRELLALSVPQDLKPDSLHCYSQQEMELIALMAQVLGEMGREAEGIDLLERTLAIMRNSRVEMKFQWGGAVFLLRELGTLYFSKGRYQKAAELKHYVFKAELRWMRGEMIHQLLAGRANCLEHLGRKYRQEYKRLYRQACCMADFYNNHYEI